jgi:hypothetical protein
LRSLDRSCGDIVASYLGPVTDAAVMCAATPTMLSPDFLSSDGPTVR